MATPDSILMDQSAPVNAELAAIRRRLHVIFSTIVTVADALETVPARRLRDYSRCLRHCVLDPLDDEIVRIEDLARRPPSAA